MAKTPVVRTTCDRCDALIDEDEKTAAAKDAVPQDPSPAQKYVTPPTPLLMLQAVPMGFEKAIVFHDLCKSCHAAVINYVKRVMKEPQDKKPKGGDEPPAEPKTDPKGQAEAAPPATPPAPADDKKGAPADTGASKDAAKGGKQRPAN